MFGSVARSNASAGSDLDLLGDFDPGASLFDPVDLLRDLERIFRRTVDLAEPSGLHWFARPPVLFEVVAV